MEKYSGKLPFGGTTGIRIGSSKRLFFQVIHRIRALQRMRKIRQQRLFMIQFSYSGDALSDAFRAIGILPGMVLGVHASFKSLGEVDGGAETILRTLLGSIGPKGTLLMPAHNPPGTVWKQSETPSDCGYLSEYFRNYSGVSRSLHPTHSCCALGKDAEYLLAGHPSTGGEAEGCPFHRLAEIGGFIMMIGVKYNACTLLHVVEELEKVPYIRFACHESYEKTFQMIPSDGMKIPYTPATFPGCSYNFRQVESELARENKIRYGKVGNAECSLARASDILDCGRKFLRSHPGMFLCDRDDCAACKRVKHLMELDRMSSNMIYSGERK